MSTSIPQIGFDRLIRLEWADMAMRVRAGMASEADLGSLLDSANLGKAARKKTRTLLNRLWLEPHQQLQGFADRAIVLRNRYPNTSATVFCWGMAISAYPFFGKVAENIGRLTSLHGDCTTAEIHRRMREGFGERETIKRVTNWVIQTQVDWGVIRHGDSRKQVLRQCPVRLEANDVAAWLVEAALRYIGRALPMATLMSTPVLFPFAVSEPLGYLLSSASSLDIQDQGAGNQVVSVRATA